MSDLPKGWVKTDLSQVGDCITGKTPKTSNRNLYGNYLPFIGPGQISVDGDISNPDKFLSEEGLGHTGLAEPGDTVMVCIGGSIGKTAFVTHALSFNQQINRVRAKCNPKYIYYYLKSSAFQSEVSQESSGSATPIINLTKWGKIQIPLAPEKEQDRIVVKLDSIFSELNKSKARLNRVPELLKKFRQSVLDAACTGKLTEDWRAENGDQRNHFTSKKQEMRTPPNLSLPEGWKWIPFGAIAEIKSNLVDPSDYSDWKHIAPDNIEKSSGKLFKVNSISEDGVKSPKHKFTKGQIIYSKIRPNLNKLIIAPYEGLCSADMYPIETQLNTEYLYYYMFSDMFLSYSTNSGTRTVLPKINQKGLCSIPVPVPPLEEQNTIAKMLKAMFYENDKTSQIIEGIAHKLNTSEQAILKQAFEGRLVNQDPADEPASVLLKRIKAERTTPTPKKKPTKKSGAGSSGEPSSGRYALAANKA